MLRWWESITGNLVLSTELKMQIGYNVQSLKSNWRSGGLYAGLYAENGATLLVGVWWEYGDKKTRLN